MLIQYDNDKIILSYFKKGLSIMESTEQYNEILLKTDELASLLKSHPFSIRYINALSFMKNDEKAQDLYNRLVKVGKMITELKDTDKALDDDFILQNEKIGKELSESPIVKEFVEAQKQYFEMMAAVQKKIIILS
jgi:cell fate (sporulation/competence/biofilm development) regulator YlbF (YheA/YmcA/DUF963 family)